VLAGDSDTVCPELLKEEMGKRRKKIERQGSVPNLVTTPVNPSKPA